MKPLSMLVVIASALIARGCVDPLEQRKTSEVQDQLGRGVTGQGTIGEIERAPGDPAGEHGVPQTHP